MVGDVFADVGHGAVRAHDDLHVFRGGLSLGCSPCSARSAAKAPATSRSITQQPAILARVFEANGAFLLQQLEGGFPEVEFQDFAFLDEQVDTRC